MQLAKPASQDISVVMYSGRGSNRPRKSLPQKVIAPRKRDEVISDCREILSLFDNLEAIESYSDRSTANLVFSSLDYCASVLAKADQLILELDALARDNVLLSLLLRRKRNQLYQNRNNFYTVYEDIWALRVAEDM